MEAEAFQLGIWKNFDELEENLSLDELTLIIGKSRKLKWDQQKYYGMLQGAKFPDDEDEVQKKIREVERRAAVQLKGETAVQQEEFADLGFGYEAV